MMTANAKTGITVAVVCAAFAALALAFLSEAGGSHPARPPIPLVDTNFLDTSTTRKSYADLVRAKEDLSDFDCYICHEKNKAPPLRLDTNQNIIVAPEHVGPATFAADDISSNNLAGIIRRLRRHADPVSTFLWQSMSNSEQVLVTDYKPSEPSAKQAQEMVVAVLNKVIGGPCLYEPGRFIGILLGAETIVHLQHSTTGPNLPHLNRLLLEDAYPVELSRDRSGDIVMGHGQHGRNNNCFNCHNETNLVLLQPRDGRELTFAQSTKLCGSCHGPTLRDWEAGAHGRISGFWDRSLGAIERKDCVNCHNPHYPHFPSRQPAPGPHPLKEVDVADVFSTRQQ
jgi:uncharacterized CHY-type Zn-finger protein